MKKKIQKYSIIIFIIGFVIAFFTFGIDYIKDYTENNLGCIGCGEVTGEGCDLATQHLEYNEKTGNQECVEGEMK